MPPDPAVEIAEGGRGFVPADDKHVDLLAVRGLIAADRASHGRSGAPYQRQDVTRQQQGNDNRKKQFRP